MDHPIDKIEWLPASDLIANSYNPNVVFTPEMKLLELSDERQASSALNFLVNAGTTSNRSATMP